MSPFPLVIKEQFWSDMDNTNDCTELAHRTFVKYSLVNRVVIDCLLSKTFWMSTIISLLLMAENVPFWHFLYFYFNFPNYHSSFYFPWFCNAFSYRFSLGLGIFREQVTSSCKVARFNRKAMTGLRSCWHYIVARENETHGSGEVVDIYLFCS